MDRALDRQSRRNWLRLSGTALLGMAAGCRSSNHSATGTYDLSSLSARAGCSSLCRAQQSTEAAFAALASLGCLWVDLSCLNWAPHVRVPNLVKDFETEAVRVENLLKANNLRVANLTFDAVETRPFDQYEPEFKAVVRLAARLRARLINLMAPSLKADRADQIAKLGRLQSIAAQSKIILTAETHCGQITEQPADALRLCDDVPGLTLTLDPSHYYAGPNQGRDFTALYPHVQGTGFRAGGYSWDKIQLPWGEGPIDFKAVVLNLEKARYRGFYISEYIEGFNQVDAVAESKRYLEWIKTL